ncbi:MAG: hypothetical protein K6D93_08790 [Saccharofermentans sp.]|jgi:putative sterol carrier protein|nr:hypothetical protein [Saccharofermentans sp.]
MSAKNKVEPTFASIYRAVEQKAAKTRFLKDTATQITLKGNLDNQPFYVKVEDGQAEIAPYEYINAPFYIDADADALTAVLNGVMTFASAVAQGFITVNGDAGQAYLFIVTLF